MVAEQNTGALIFKTVGTSLSYSRYNVHILGPSPGFTRDVNRYKNNQGNFFEI